MKILFLPVMQPNKQSSKSAIDVLLEIYSRIDNLEKTILLDDFGKPLDEKYISFLRSFNVIKIKSTGFLNLLRLFLIILKNGKQFDLLYCTGAYPDAAYFALIVSKMLSIPFVIRVHNNIDYEMKYHSILRSMMLKAALKHSLKIIALENPETIISLRNYSYKLSRFCNGINLDEYYQSSKVYDAVFIGSLEERKGIKYLPIIWKQVLKKLPNSRLLVLGSGSLKEWLFTEIKKRGTVDNVIIKGFVSENEKKDILAKTKVLFFPSLLEGFGVVITEAMASMCIPVIWNLSCFDIFKKGVIKIAFEELDKYSESIILLLSDSDVRLKICHEGYEYAKTFSWGKCVELEKSTLSELPNLEHCTFKNYK